MGYDVETAERVRRILSVRRDVAEKKMVGGLSFLVDGSMCCGITGSGLMVRVGPGAVGEALAEPHVRPMEMAGRPLRAFICVDPEGYRTDADLAAWVQRGIAFVSTLPEKKEPKVARAREVDDGERLFRNLSRRFARDPEVNQGTGFGTNPGLRVGTKIFAMLGKDGLVIKLPKERVDHLVASGTGARFDPRGDGRLMKEWATVPAIHGRQWGRLAEEALQFVRSAGRKPSATNRAGTE